MDDWEKINETSLPEKEDFYSHLNKENITDVKRSITAVRAGATKADRATYRDNKQAIFKNCAPFTNCIS